MIQRTFIPGSQWLYFKLYTGEKTSDNLLTRGVDPILRKLHKDHYITKWFFIRYSDPQFHLRVRLLVNDKQNIGEIISLFNEELLKWNKDHLLWKVQLDTYEREIERYDGNLIEEAESIFYLDSKCILSIIKKINGNENYRWMIALKLIDELLSNFGLTLKDKQKLIEELSHSFKSEFGFNDFNSKQFNTKFRENKKTVESILNSTIDENTFTSLYLPIEKRTKELSPIVRKIKLVKKNKFNGLIKSYLHMSINRIFQSRNREHEMILYNFMFRYYSSEIAKMNWK